MNITREELAAFADGELKPGRQSEVAAIVAADPELGEEVRAHKELRARLTAHFAPVLEGPLPERLTSPLLQQSEVIDLASARARRTRKIARWSWIVGPALAASLTLAIFLSRETNYANGAVASALTSQLVAQQSGGDPVRILLSFRDHNGDYCRAFAARAQSGIACRDNTGWRLRMKAPGVSRAPTEYQMAGSPSGRVLEEVQTMSAGAALDAADEEKARALGWR